MFSACDRPFLGLELCKCSKRRNNGLAEGTSRRSKFEDGGIVWERKGEEIPNNLTYPTRLNHPGSCKNRNKLLIVELL